MEDVSAVIDPSWQAYYKSDGLALNADWLNPAVLQNTMIPIMMWKIFLAT